MSSRREKIKLAFLQIHAAPYRNDFLRYLGQEPGIELTIYSYKEEDPAHSYWELPEEGVVAHSLGRAWQVGSSLLHWRMLNPFFLRRFDLVAVTAHSHMTSLLAYFWCWVWRIPYIYMADTVWERRTSWLMRRVKAAIYRRAAFLFVTGRASVRFFMEQYGVAPERLQVGYYNFDYAKIRRLAAEGRREREAVRRAWGVGEGEQVALMAANFLPFREHLELIRWFEREGWATGVGHLVLVGGGGGGGSGGEGGVGGREPRMDTNGRESGEKGGGGEEPRISTNSCGNFPPAGAGSLIAENCHSRALPPEGGIVADYRNQETGCDDEGKKGAASCASAGALSQPPSGSDERVKAGAASCTAAGALSQPPSGSDERVKADCGGKGLPPSREASGMRLGTASPSRDGAEAPDWLPPEGGTPARGTEAECRRYVRERGLEGRVHFVPGVKFEALVRLLAAADIYVHSGREPYSTMPLLARLAGLELGYHGEIPGLEDLVDGEVPEELDARVVARVIAAIIATKGLVAMTRVKERGDSCKK